MSLETVVLALSLLLGIILLILIAYLISRINDLEARALSSGNRADATPKDSNSSQVFAGLGGRQLWDEWVAIANGGEDSFQIQGDRERFLALIEQHIRAIIKAGVEHGETGAGDQPPNPIKVKMLRGEFESYLPSSQAERLYKLSVELGSSDAEERSTLKEPIREVIESISMQLDAGSSLIEGALRDLSDDDGDDDTDEVQNNPITSDTSS